MSKKLLNLNKKLKKKGEFSNLKFLLFIAIIVYSGNAKVTAQTAYAMSGGNKTWDFADIANWTNNFASGTDAANWGSVAVNATGTVPDGVRTTVSSATFTTTSTGGVQKGATNMYMLSTGSTSNGNSVAVDLYLDFTGRTAGTLSFDYACVFNSSGNRGGSLKVYTSTNGSSWTELSGAALSVVNNTASSGSKTSLTLPSGFNGSSTARIRFYQYADAVGTTGSRPKISIDNVAVTSTATSSAPTLTTPTATSITDASATLGATITLDGGSSITERGTSFKTSSPVVAADNQLAEGGTSVSAYTHSRISLAPQTQYFYAGYATNSTGTALSSEASFRTLSSPVSSQSGSLSATTFSSTQINLTIGAAGFPASGATQAGYLIIYATGTPSLSSSNGTAPAAGVGSIFTTSATALPSTPATAVNVTGLSPGTTYNFLIIPYTWDGTNTSTYNYLTTSAPTASAATTSGSPVVTTPIANTITNNSAVLGATVSSNGGSSLTSRGTVFKTSASVTISDNALAEGGTAVSVFTHSRTSLNPETRYFFAGYAINASSSALSSESSFRTLSNPPTVQAGLSALAASTTQINLTVSAATFPASGATQAGYIVVYATGTPTFNATNGTAPSAGVGTIFSTSPTVLPTSPSTSINVTGLTQSTLYNFLVIPYTWDGTNPETYNYLTSAAPTANATTTGPVNIAIQDFEASPATPTWNYAGGGATNSTASKFNGAASYRFSGSQTLTMDNLDISGYTNVTLSVAYAGSGPDSGEDLYMDVSYDGGTTWVGTGSVKLVDGLSNTNININTTNLAGPTTQASNPWPTSISASETQIRVRFRIDAASAAAEYYFIDDVKVTGILNTDPRIIRTPSSLSGFTQNSATPSSEQTYTVSGNNLTGSVSIVPPTGFEISTTTGGSFSSTNPIVLTQSGGDIVGEPVTIYVRQNSSSLGTITGDISHNSAGATAVNTALSGTRTGTYYSKSTGNLDDVNNWGTNTDGSGTVPTNFTSNGIIYEIRNRATATIGSNWTVSGTASKVVLGDGTNAIDFTIPSSFQLTGTIDISSAAELTIENVTSPTLGTIANNSTIEFNNVAATLSTTTTYKNLKLSGTGTKTFPGNTTTISGNLILDGVTIDGASIAPFSTILLGGNLTYVGTVTPPADANSITLSTNGTAAGTQTFSGTGNTMRWFRIQTTTSNTIVLSTTGGTSHIYLGNNSGGGITLLDGSVLNMGGNDLQLFNNAATTAAFVMGTGTISTTSTTDFNIARTGNGALGTLKFTTGENTIGNLILNHTGTTNTLTIGNALNVNGIITITDGTLASDGFITLKSNASSSASIASIGVGGSITGNVTVETYIPSGKRAYRLIGHPISTPLALSSIIDNIHITGTNGGGFDVTASNSPSSFNFVESNFNGASNSGWSAYTNTTNTIGVGQGARLFIRGPRSQPNLLDGSNPTPLEAVLDYSGQINQGNIDVALNYTGANGANAGWNLIANPYPSKVDIGLIAAGNRNNISSFAIWAPNNGTRGAFVSTSFGSSFVIPAGSAFFVQSGSAANFTFTEADKTTSAVSATLFKTNEFNKNAIQLNVLSDDTIFWDQLVIRDRSEAFEAKDYMDANKMENPDVNLYSISPSNERFAIDHRAIENNSIVNLGFETTASYHFTIKVGHLDMPEYDVILIDNFLNQQVSLKQGSTYHFSSTTEPNSKGSKRFQILFLKNTVGSKEYNENNWFAAYPNPASTTLNVLLKSQLEGDFSYQVYNYSGQEMSKGNFNFTRNQPLVLNVEQLNSGIYFLIIHNAQGSQTIKFTK